MTTKTVKTIVSKSSYDKFANELKELGVSWDVGETPSEYNPFKHDPFINSEYISVVFYKGFLFYDDHGLRDLKKCDAFIDELKVMYNEQEKNKT